MDDFILQQTKIIEATEQYDLQIQTGTKIVNAVASILSLLDVTFFKGLLNQSSLPDDIYYCSSCLTKDQKLGGTIW